jgi:peptide deformylase
MVGLAAPQLGFAIQLVFIDLAAGAKRDGKFGNNLFMVNPKIIEKSIKKIKCNEGCYSARVEKFTIYGVVSRSEKVKVQYMALDGKNKTQTFSGFTSVVAQHEIDHLNGKIFIHRIRGKNKLEAITQNGSEKESIIMDSEFYWKQVAQIKK